MLIYYYGHAQFLIESSKGLQILTDPYDDRVNFPLKDVKADIVTVSHDHFDHCYIQKVTGEPNVIREEGKYDIEGGAISSIKSYHDEEKGALRGENLIFRYDLEGLSIAHLGDLGHYPNDEQLEFLKGVDILMLPIGGKYTVDAKTASKIVRELKPKITIPMHYKVNRGGLSDVSGLEPFYKEMLPITPTKAKLLRVTKEDIGEFDPLIVLSIKDLDY